MRVTPTAAFGFLLAASSDAATNHLSQVLVDLKEMVRPFDHPTTTQGMSNILNQLEASAAASGCNKDGKSNAFFASPTSSTCKNGGNGAEEIASVAVAHGGMHLPDPSAAVDAAQAAGRRVCYCIDFSGKNGHSMESSYGSSSGWSSGGGNGGSYGSSSGGGGGSHPMDQAPTHAPTNGTPQG